MLIESRSKPRSESSTNSRPYCSAGSMLLLLALECLRFVEREVCKVPVRPRHRLQVFGPLGVAQVELAFGGGDVGRGHETLSARLVTRVPLPEKPRRTVPSAPCRCLRMMASRMPRSSVSGSYISS